MPLYSDIRKLFRTLRIYLIHYKWLVTLEHAQERVTRH